MITVTEASKFPLVTGTGKILLKDLMDQRNFQHDVTVEFHGVRKTYPVKTSFPGSNRMLSELVVLLDDHGVERPSLFGVKIKNEVPLKLEVEWVKK